MDHDPDQTNQISEPWSNKNSGWINPEWKVVETLVRIFWRTQLIPITYRKFSWIFYSALHCKEYLINSRQLLIVRNNHVVLSWDKRVHYFSSAHNFYITVRELLAVQKASRCGCSTTEKWPQHSKGRISYSGHPAIPPQILSGAILQFTTKSCIRNFPASFIRRLAVSGAADHRQRKMPEKPKVQRRPKSGQSSFA